VPIYEFYCQDCHTVFSFFSRRVDTEKRPGCPRCARPDLERRMSLFAISKGRSRESGEEDLSGVDDERMERAMESMAAELEHVDENDPVVMGRMMRRLFDAAGMKMGPGMEEALRRMEAGEDPDQVEAELGDALEAEDPLQSRPKVKGRLEDLRRRLLPPQVDPNLYEM